MTEQSSSWIELTRIDVRPLGINFDVPVGLTRFTDQIGGCRRNTEDGWVTQKELMGLTGFSRNKVSDLLDDLVSNQRVVSIKIGSASASNPNRYYSIPSLAV